MPLGLLILATSTLLLSRWVGLHIFFFFFLLITESSVSNVLDFSLKLQATDGGGKSSLGVLEIIVIPGPNVLAPVFPRDSYEITVAESSPIGFVVNTFQVNNFSK